MPTPARPTLHTLRRLAGLGAWDNVDHQRMILARDITVPVWQLQHPAIKKAAEEFAGDVLATEGSHKYVSGLSNPRWLAIKTQQFRGAIWEDPTTGQAWLCDVGLRRAGQGEDFYASFMAAVEAAGPESFYPTEEDQQLLLRETTDVAMHAWDRQVCEQAASACVDALTDRVLSYELIGPGGGVLCEVTIIVDEVDDDTTPSVDTTAPDNIEVLVEIEWKDWALQDAEGWVAQLIQTSINPAELAWHSYPINGKPNYSIVTTAALVRACRARTFSLTDAELGVSVPGDRAHRCRTTDISKSVVTGTPMQSLCGCWFVHRASGDDLPRCAECEAIYESLPA